MKISTNWLKTLLNTSLSNEEISKRLTAAGLEVEGTETVESITGGLKGLVVGEIKECGKHPDADRLSVTKVDIGEPELLNIVCGAPNVAAGQKVIVATIGATLFPTEGDSFEIKKSKIRGVPSEGMICAEDEIGLGKSHAGIMVLPESTQVGLAAANYFKLESDTVLEIGLTPNRSDAASHLGVARDLAALLNSELPQPEYSIELPGLQPLPKSSGDKTLVVNVEADEACKRYSGLIISGVAVKESPDWLKNRLNAIGVKPINNIVDVTNFVLHELGQPLHAFDFAKITGNKIIVRTAKPGEKFTTLDAVERILQANDLVICDEKSPMCLAGIFGGIKSGVSAATTSIFLESAYFDSAHIRKSSKHHALKTDASFRFERGTDPNMTLTALTRAANLIFELAGGTLAAEIIDVYPNVLEPYKVAFSYSNCNELIGKEVDRHLIKAIILNLGIEISSEGSDGLLLHVPLYKTDVTREVDVIEEVMRIYGYDHIEVSKHINYSAFNETKNQDAVLEAKVHEMFVGFGFNEIMNLSLSKQNLYSETDSLVKLLNPLSQDLNVLRADLLYSGLESISFNSNRKNNNLKFYEIGRTYQLITGETTIYKEEKQLGLFICGDIFKENPYGLQQKSNFSYVKACVDALLAKCGIHSVKRNDTTFSNLSYGLSYSYNNKPLVEFGLVSKSSLKKFDIVQDVYYANFKWEVLLKAFSKQKIAFEELSKFPVVRRDLALLIEKSVSFSQIEDLAFATEKKLLTEVNLFDIYQDEKLGNKKSYAVSFTLLNKEATLTDKQIEAVMEKLISTYRDKLGAELR